MILAAGRGERMKPLTDSCPKPLLKIAGMPLIEHLIRKLVAAGITEIVINHAWLGEQIVQYLGNGQQFGAVIEYSAESEGALETAGGIIQALPLLGNEPFLVINGDVYTDFDFTHLPQLTKETLAHLWLVNNPEHNLNGDFYLLNKTVSNNYIKQSQAYTFSGIGLYRPDFFNGDRGTNTVLPLAPMLRKAIDDNAISAELLAEFWADIGTPQRLQELNNQLQ